MSTHPDDKPLTGDDFSPPVNIKQHEEFTKRITKKVIDETAIYLNKVTQLPESDEEWESSDADFKMIVQELIDTLESKIK